MVTSSKKRTDAKVRKKPAAGKAPASTPSTAPSNGSSPSNGETLRKLYASLLRCRLMQEYVQRLPSSRMESGRYELALGHEAVTAGATADLRAEDTIAASRRNLAALIAAGMTFAELLTPGNHSHACGSWAHLAPLISSSVPEDAFNAGTGIALAHKLEEKQNVVVALCSEESPSLERWREAWRIAAVHKLPIIYIMRSSRAGETSSAWLEDFSFCMKDYGFPGIAVDGRDVVAVWRVAQESIHRARNGSGPTLIDCRMESAEDPLAHMEHYMRKRSLWDDGWKKELAGQIRREIAAAEAAARTSVDRIHPGQVKHSSGVH
jgi:TPP-dependent pyruvate/acetoin dehydrogenase alpha subunit